MTTARMGRGDNKGKRMIYNNPRIDLADSLMSAIIKMADGNPGAVRVLMELFQQGPTIDPYSALGALSGMLHLDTLDIYGHRIWCFYKDVCGEDLTTMIGLMRANQLGFLRESELIRAIDGERMGGEWAQSYVAKVRERLPAFGQPIPA
jgi:hypothetical protein